MSDDAAEDLRGRYEAGEKKMLLLAILYATMSRSPLPDWAADAFKNAFELVERGGAGSWDDVFGRPHPAGEHLKSIRRAYLRFEVWGLVRYFHEREGRPIDDGLFEHVGEMTGLGKTTTIKKLYYEAEHAMRSVKRTYWVSLRPEYYGVGTGRYVLSTDPRAMQSFPAGLTKAA